MKQYIILAGLILVSGFTLLGHFIHTDWYYAFILIGPLVLLGLHDIIQKKHSILRNFPVLGHGRFLMEAIRPELQQYFVESNLNGMPISRELRSIVYQRSKGDLQTVPFGTQKNVYAEGYEWVGHSMFPQKVDPKSMRVWIGRENSGQPYESSLLNISALSFGALSKTAILALNEGAHIGGFSHNTGEGGLTGYHLAGGGDLVWQIGTGYFGCRTSDGQFSEEIFAQKAIQPQVKMIEIKLSQGAKPSHGGILPAVKVTPEIAAIRGVEMGSDILSPACHRAFEGPGGLVLFADKLRQLSGGKPVGIKLCVGRKDEFEDIVKAMLRLNKYFDFIAVDGGEGGTGASPLEFTDSVGMPLKDGLSFVHDTLQKHGIRQKMKIIASGKIITAFEILVALSLGADLVNSARGMMLALGCIHAVRCNTNTCPVGITTNDPELYQGLDVSVKKVRVARYHAETIVALAELTGAMGYSHPSQITRKDIFRRVSINEVRTYKEIYG
ncbi:MAG: hypothetical protein ACD_73C00185G0003 [uncultured bacterium]|nr:MAG: hypothetical protein ACD_73C00185G0003 [uncultured bacterium]